MHPLWLDQHLLLTINLTQPSSDRVTYAKTYSQPREGNQVRNSKLASMGGVEWREMQRGEKVRGEEYE